MVQRADDVELLERERTAEIPTSMKRNDMLYAQEEETIEPLRRDVRNAEEDLVSTLEAIRKKVSYDTLKSLAAHEARAQALEGPKKAAMKTIRSIENGARQAFNVSTDRPLLPLAAAVTGLLLFSSVFFRKKQ